MDPESDRAIRALWERLPAEGVSRTVLDAGIGPHVTLVVSPDLDASRTAPLLEAVARVAQAVAICAAAKLPASTRLDRLLLVEFPAVTPVTASGTPAPPAR